MIFAGRFLHNEAGVFPNSTRQKLASVWEGGKEDQGNLILKEMYTVVFLFCCKLAFTLERRSRWLELLSSQYFFQTCFFLNDLVFRWIASIVSSSWEAKFHLDPTGPTSLLSEQKRFQKEMVTEKSSSYFSCRWRCWDILLLKRTSGGVKKTKKRLSNKTRMCVHMCTHEYISWLEVLWTET